MMPRDSRMFCLVHALIHMDAQPDRVTSEDLAAILATNPVVVRRLMSGLKTAGIVSSEKGHGGGWKLSRDLADISLIDIYRAIGEPPLLNIGPHAEQPTDSIEQAVNAHLQAMLKLGETYLLDKFAGTTVADFAERDSESGIKNIGRGTL